MESLNHCLFIARNHVRNVLALIYPGPLTKERNFSRYAETLVICH